jgi:hypothetical protein
MGVSRSERLPCWKAGSQATRFHHWESGDQAASPATPGKNRQCRTRRKIVDPRPNKLMPLEGLGARCLRKGVPFLLQSHEARTTDDFGDRHDWRWRDG